MRIFRTVLALALCSVSLAAQTPPQAAPPIAGLWEGSIDGPMTLPVAVRLNQATDGTWTGTIDIPAQGAKGLALANVVVEPRTVRFSIAGIPGSPTFVARLSEDGGSMSGDFIQGPTKATFSLTRNLTGKPTTTAARPQEPKPPFPYNDDEVVIPTPTPGVTLAGVLTTPKSGQAYPVVLLISGSGQQDRDETIAGHRPFLVLADYLTRRGIAVLRVDDRGVGRSTGSAATATTEDFASDALASVSFLRSYASTKDSKIGLIGHSEGGVIAPMVASRSADVAFQVLMAGSGVTGEQILYQQAAALAQASGASAAQVAQQRALQEQLYTIIKTEKDVTAMREKIRAINGDAASQMLTLPWFRFFLTYDPAPTLRQTKIPTLALNGERDLQVPFKENLAAIEAALRAGGNTRFTIRSFPELNHLFQTSKTGLPGEYGIIEETMAPVVLETIANWIGRQ